MAKQSPVSESSARLQLTDELPVVAESTTSRLLVTNDAMRIVQFTFDAGETLTEHASPRAVAVHLVSGRMRFTIDGTEQPWATVTSYTSRQVRHTPWSPKLLAG